MNLSPGHTGARLSLPARRLPQLVCPAGSLRALQVAVKAGADAIYLGLRDATTRATSPD